MKMPLLSKAIDALHSCGHDGARPSCGSAGRLALPAMIAAVAACAILPARASTFTVGGSGNNFTISRTGDTSAAETVLYRTVPLSAFPGQHYTEKGGTLVFAPGQPCPGLFLSVSLSPRQSCSTAFSEILKEELGDYLP